MREVALHKEGSRTVRELLISAVRALVGRKRLTVGVGTLALVAGAILVLPASAFANGPFTPNTAGPATADGITPIYHAGNITSCPIGTTIVNTSDTGPGNQAVNVSENGVTFNTTLTTQNGINYLAFTQTGLISFTVFVKGGPAYDEYVYASGNASDSLLHMPVNNGGNISTISHYLVCGTPDLPTFPTVLVGYADDEHGGTAHNPGAPWPPAGQPANVNFAGCPQSATQDYITTCATPSGDPPGTGGTYNGDYDSGAIQLQNNTTSPMNVAMVTVTLNGGTSSPCTIDIWPHNVMVVPANGALVLAQTTVGGSCAQVSVSYNFDSSEAQITQCTPDTIAPTITVTLSSGASKTYTDSALALTSGGNDPGNCGGPLGTDETVAWTATT